MSKVLIVGATRGIGYELAKQYKEAGHEVMVLCRKISDDLKDLGVEVVTDVDVKDDSIISSLANRVSWDSIDILIHNSGILSGDSYPDISLDNMREHFEVNTLGPMKTVLALRDKFVKGTKVGIVSSRVGSIADNSSSNNYAYRTSKTAVNMVATCLALDLKDSGVALAILHPGYVRTKLTGNNGFIDPDESAEGLIKRMEELNLENTGIFVHTSGEVLPW